MIVEYKKVVNTMCLYSQKNINYNINPYRTSKFPSFNYNSAIFSCPLYRYFSGTNYSRDISLLGLSNTFRQLWEQHSAWTRMTIMSLVFDLPDVELVTQRLLQNPVDFGNALKEFYGDEIASKFSDLLKEHLVIAAELVKAAKAGDNKTAADAEKRWYANADEIAAFLAKINPNWSEEEWKMMLHRHLMLVKAEAVSMLTKNYEQGIKIYDEIENQALGMADEMTQGIVNQFPERIME